MDAQDDVWIAEYQRDDSEEAFTQLVRRYLPLVHGCAVRQAGSQPHLIDDVVQRVFIDFAGNAKKMKPGGNVAGWLHRHTYFVAGSALRSEKRRQIREQQADVMNSESDSVLKQIGPVIDEAIDQLREKDRIAVMLRFFEQRDLGAVGTALGITEDAAQKRVARALERLRVLIGRRGIMLSTAALAGALAESALVAGPTASATVVSSTALGAAGSAVAADSYGIFQFIFMSKAKIAVAAALVVAGIGGTAIVQGNRNKEAEIENLRNRKAELEAAALASNDRTEIDPAELERLRADQREAIKLRGDLMRLKDEVTEAHRLALAAQARAEAAENAASAKEETALPEFRVFSSQATGNIAAGQSMLFGGWKTGTNSVTYTVVTPELDPSNPEVVVLSAKLIEMDPGSAAAELATLQTNIEGNLVLDAAKVTELFEKWQNTPGANLLSAPTMTVASGREGRISVVTETRQTKGGPVEVGPEIDFLATKSADGGQIHLKVDAKLVTAVN